MFSVKIWMDIIAILKCNGQDEEILMLNIIPCCLKKYLIYGIS
jgi:hypothetical protein